MKEIIYRKRFFLKKIFSIFLSPLSSVILKDKELILFHGSDLHRFSENGRYLFLHLHHNSELRVVWMTSSKALKNRLISLGYQSEIHASLGGVLLYLKAGCVVGSGSKYPDFAGSVGRKTVKLCLHHGSGPRTTNGLAVGNQYDFVKAANQWDYFNFTSRWMAVAVGKLQFFLPDEKRVILGYPRCDHLIEPSCGIKMLHSASLPTNYDPNMNSKIVLFAPTWRESADFGWNTLQYLDGYDLDKLNSFLEANNTIIYVSLHPKSRQSQEYSLPSHIRIIEEGLLYDVNEFLPHVDLLITDYSSIATDFLLTGKQVVYCWPDYDYYLEYVGLLEPFHSSNPGIVIETLDELFVALQGKQNIESSNSGTNLSLYFEKYYELSLRGACNRTQRFLKEALQ